VKRKIIPPALILVAVMAVTAAITFIIIYMRPIPFSDVISDKLDFEWNMHIRIFYWDEHNRSGVREYSFSPSSEEFTNIRNIVYEYHFYRTLRTYITEATGSGPPAGFWLHLNSGRNSIISGATGEIIVNSRFYRMDNIAEDAMRNKILEILNKNHKPTILGSY